MKEIRISKGLVAMVDDDDYAALSQHNWCARVVPRWPTYAAAHWGRSPIPGKKWRKAYMHQVIMGTVGMGRMVCIDHIDGNGLNNQRANLRICTPADNNANSHRKKTSGYKGVFHVTDRPLAKPYRVDVTRNGKNHRIGYFAIAEEGAAAYDEAAKRIHGEYALTNAGGAI